MPPKIDVVLQATGIHGWNVSEGYINGVKALGCLGRVFRPKAEWGASEPFDDDGLFEYLKKPSSQIILLLGFDWHSQPLYSTQKWVDAWKATPLKKVLYSLESVIDQDETFGNTKSSECFRRSGSLVDCISVSVETDLDLARSVCNEVIFQPYAVDPTVFVAKKPFFHRNNRAYFRGKTIPYFGEQTYSARRHMIEHLKAQGLTDIIPYADRPVTPDEICDEFNQYRIAVNLPAVTMRGHPNRVTEALSCGCCLITPYTTGTIANSLFRDGVHLLYYDPSSPEALKERIYQCIQNEVITASIAQTGYAEFIASHTHEHRIDELLRFLSLNANKDKITYIYDGKSKLDQIVVLKTDAIGDAILASGMLRHIYEHYNRPSITMVCKEETEPLYKHCPYISQVIHFSTEGDEGFRAENQIQTIASMQSKKPYIALTPTLSRDAICDFLVGNATAPNTFGYIGKDENSTPEHFEFYQKVYTHKFTNPPEHFNEIENNRLFLENLGIKVDTLKPEIWISQQEERYAEKLFRENNLAIGDPIAIAPGSRYEVKVYPQFDLVVNYLKSSKIILLGSSGEDHDLEEKIQSMGISVLNLCGRSSLLESAAVIKRCKLLVGNDSSCAHLASALGVPNVVILGGGTLGDSFRTLPKLRSCHFP